MDGACDQLSLVIKAFHAVEKRIEQALVTSLPVPHRLELRRMSLLLKVDFLGALGFIDPQRRPLFDKINAIRNAYAHDPHKVFGDEDFARVKAAVKAHVPNVDDSVVPDPINTLKALFVFTYACSFNAYKNAMKQKAGNFITSLWLAELERDEEEPSVHKTVAQVDAEIETKLRVYLTEKFPEFDLDEILPDLLDNQRKSRKSGG